MNYFDEGFNGYLNGEKPRSTAERLTVNWLKNSEQLQQILAGHHEAEKLDRETRPARA